MPESSYKVALLGTGYIAEWHIRALQMIPQARVTAVCDLNRGQAESFARRCGVAAAYGSFAELWEREKPQVVHVLVPAEHHFEAAREVLESGASVFLEKPMCSSTEQCDALIALAEQRGARIGVNHNFLHSEPYRRLKQDLEAGRLGRVDRIQIIWNLELELATRGPFDAWMLRAPENILLEVGPHSVAHLLDLADAPDRMTVRADEPMDLPNGARFYRRWRVEAGCGRTVVALFFNFGVGFTEHAIHVHGLLSTATADLERNTYVRRSHTAYDYDLDRLARVREEGKALARQSWRDFRALALGKLRRTQEGNPFGTSLATSVRAFHESLCRSNPASPGLGSTARFGREVVSLCERIGQVAKFEPAPVSIATADSVGGRARAEIALERTPEVLVLGATGFIGRELVRQLVAQGLGVRALVRRPGGLDRTFDPRFVEVMCGDASRPDQLDTALAGIRHVYHLAKAASKSGRELVRLDTALSRTVAEKCLEHEVERLIYTSTIAVYYAGRAAGTITEDTPPDPTVGRCNAYARAKTQTEAELLEMHRSSDLPVVIFRPGIVIGRGGSPFHPGAAHWPWNGVARILGQGTNTLPIVLVEDVAAALVAARTATAIDGESFNLIGEPELTAKEYVGEMERCSGMRFDTQTVWPLVYYLADLAKWAVKIIVRHPELYWPSYRYWESRTQRAYYDCSKAKRLLGWEPTTDRDTILRRGIHEPMAEHLR